MSVFADLFKILGKYKMARKPRKFQVISRENASISF